MRGAAQGLRLLSLGGWSYWPTANSELWDFDCDWRKPHGQEGLDKRATWFLSGGPENLKVQASGATEANSGSGESVPLDGETGSLDTGNPSGVDRGMDGLANAQNTQLADCLRSTGRYCGSNNVERLAGHEVCFAWDVARIGFAAAYSVPRPHRCKASVGPLQTAGSGGGESREPLIKGRG